MFFLALRHPLQIHPRALLYTLKIMVESLQLELADRQLDPKTPSEWDLNLPTWSMLMKRCVSSDGVSSKAEGAPLMIIDPRQLYRCLNFGSFLFFLLTVFSALQASRICW
jgi:hypothetical protein